MIFMEKIIVFFLMINILFINGCYTVRKKFVRESKYQKDTTVYVDFKDYPEALSRDAYLDYYLFIQGWLDELIQALARGGNRKKQKQAINEVIINFEQVRYFFNEEGKEKTSPLYGEFLEVREKIHDPYLDDTERGNLIRKVESTKREFERVLRWSNASLWMD